MLLMNQRIEQLARQAGALPTQNCGVPQWYIDEDEFEKFAELIVKECIACAVWVGKNNYNPVEPIYTIHAVKQRIKQQFGVE